MNVLDLALAIAGRSHAAISGGGRAPRQGHLVITGLLALSIAPTFVIGLTPTPLEMSFESLRQGAFRDRTSWLRLEGDLQPATGRQGAYVYTLRDPANQELAVTVITEAPLPTGHTEVTGQPLGGVRVEGTFDAFYADVPTEPARHDPWPLIALPGMLAISLLVGERAGYPVLRSERAPRQRPTPLRPGERLEARWTGRASRPDLPIGVTRACVVETGGTADVCELTVTDELGVHSVLVRRASPKSVGRLCRIDGCQPGLEVHATGADVMFEFATRADRDRLAASID